MNKLSWDLIRSFLIVAQQGSLSAAARQLGVSQPTLSRDIQALEKDTKLQLFKRTTQGLLLTESGQRLVDSATQMNLDAESFFRQIQGLSTELEGSIRISANEIVGIYLLPPLVTAFRKQHPGVSIEIVISNQASNLNKREADIAIRMFRPTQPDLVAKRLPDMPLGFFAHRCYVEQFGEPQNLNEFKQHSIIGMDEGMEFINEAKAMGVQLTPDDFRIRTDNFIMQINLARCGAGIVGTHVDIAKHWPDLIPVMNWLSLPPLECWLVCHADTQYNARIRELRQFIGQWFSEDPYHAIIL